MTTSQALFAGAALIAVGLFFGNGAHPASAMANGPYQLMQHSNVTANAGVFRVDTATGEVSYCYVNGTNENVGVACTKPVR